MRAFPAIVAMAFLVAGCEKPAALAVEDAWVRMPAAAGRPGAAYFTVQGGAQADTLVAVSTPAALRTELHESMHAGGAMTMQPLRDVAVPAGGTLAFAPGGKHVMLYDIGPAVKPGQQVPLTLAFAGGKRIEVQARVVGAGDPAP